MRAQRRSQQARITNSEPIPQRYHKWLNQYHDSMEYPGHWRSLKDDYIVDFDVPSRALDAYNAVKQPLEQRISQMKELLRIALASPQRQNRIRQLRRGRLDNGRVHKVITAENSRVFQKASRKEKLNIAVALTIDASESMELRSMRKLRAFDNLVVFAEALASLHIPFEIQWLTLKGWGQCPLFVAKALKDKWDDRTKARTAMYYLEYQRGWTMNAQWIAHAAARLQADSRAKAKIVIDFTDGYTEHPSFGHAIGAAKESCQKALKHLMDQISTFAVFIDMWGELKVFQRCLLQYRWMSFFDSNDPRNIEKFNKSLRENIKQCVLEHSK